MNELQPSEYSVMDQPSRSLVNFSLKPIESPNALDAEWEVVFGEVSITSVDLLKLFALVLARYSGKTEVVIGKTTSLKEEAIDIFQIAVDPNAKLQEWYQSEALTNSISIPVPLLEKTEHYSNVLLVQKRDLERYKSNMNFDLLLDFDPLSDQNTLSLYGRKKYFTKARLEKLVFQIQRWMEIAESSDALIQNISVLEEKECKAIAAFETGMECTPLKESISNQFEECAYRFPMQIAIQESKAQWTYAELNDKANQLAREFQDTYSIKKGSIVAVLHSVCAESIIAYLAVLKLGGAYLPLDVKTPENRVMEMLKEAKAELLVTNSEHMLSYPEFRGGIYALDIQLPAIQKDSSNLAIAIKPTDLAYVIFTSGSSGTPKGVMVQHSALSNLSQWHIRSFGLDTNANATLFANAAFDASVWELWPYILSGATVFPVAASLKLELDALEQYLAENSISHSFLPTPIYELWVLQNRSWPKGITVFTGGDELKKGNAEGVRIINNYGPTETTVVSSSLDLSQYSGTGVLPIGKPIDNTRLYVLDHWKNTCAIGIEGDLYIAGDSLAKGYIHQPSLTEAHFEIFNGERMYRTGDRALWLESGDLLFKGRSDNQVQIKGFRIELGEITNKIMAFPCITDARVLVQEENGSKQLIAFYICDAIGEEQNLESFLEARLPEYMVPSKLIPLGSFPITRNGKIDEKRLLEKLPENLPEKTELALSEEEKSMLHIWQSVLHAPSLGIEDNFFSLGGDSIKAIGLIYEVNEKFQSTLKLMDVFKFDTPKKLLAQLEQTGTTHEEALLEQEVEEALYALKSAYLSQRGNSSGIEDVFPVADIQLGMLYHGLFGEGDAIYHDQIVHQIKIADFDPKVLNKTLILMANQHGILRTSFDLENSIQPVQIVHESISVAYDHEDLISLSKGKQEKRVNQFILDDRKQPFDSSEPGLWRLRTFALSKDTIVIVFICHHAIIDGWSDASFSTELYTLYQYLIKDPEYIPLPLRSSYKDYVKQELISKKQPRLSEFWKKELEGFEKTKFLFDLGGKEAEDLVVNVPLGIELKDKMIAFGLEHNVTPRAICLSVYLKIIQELSIMEEVTIGLHTHNRPLTQDSDQILGCFLNSIPLRFGCALDKSWQNHIERVNDKLIALTEYNPLSLMEISKLFPEINEGDTENPFFDTLFAYLDFHVYQQLEEDKQEDNFEDQFTLQTLEVQGQGVNNTHFNFILNATLEEFNLLIFYKSMGLKEPQVVQIGEQFKAALAQLLEAPNAPLSNAASPVSTTEGSASSVAFNF